jgi:hypothetical protein
MRNAKHGRRSRLQKDGREIIMMLCIIQILVLVFLSSLCITGFQSNGSLSRRSRAFIPIQQAHQYFHSDRLRSAQQRVPTTSLRSSSPVASSNNYDNNDAVYDDGKKVVQVSQLDTSQIVDMIEVSFIHACLQLAQGYVDILKLFIVACKAAFDRNINVQELMDKVNNQANQSTAGRELAVEEVALRSTWIQSVYLMLAYIEHQNITTLVQVGPDLDQDVLRLYSNVLPTIVKFRETGNSHAQVIGLAETLAKELELDAVDQAVTTQTMRVLWYTLVVLSEEAMADPSMPPRPNIPGTY